MAQQLQTATFASGCFWCTEAIFKQLRGVFLVVSGYTGGKTKNPTNETVSTGTTGHAEAIQMQFDPSVVAYEQLVSVFFLTHDPTTRNRQGNDIGEDYRSAIFFHTPDQQRAANKVLAEITTAGVYSLPIVTEIVPFSQFFPAEQDHQNFFEKNPEQPYCQVIIGPKVAKFRKRFSDLLKS